MAPSSVLFKLLVSILVIKTLFHFIYSVTATYKLLARVSSDFPLSGSIIPITFYVRYYHLHQLQDSDCSLGVTLGSTLFFQGDVLIGALQEAGTQKSSTGIKSKGNVKVE